MEDLGTLMEKLAPLEAINKTYIPGINIYKSLRYLPPFPLLYQQGIIIVGQGHKRIHFADTIYEYNSDNYLVVSVPIPAECETFGSEDEPFLCMCIDIDPVLLNSIIYEMGILKTDISPKKEKGLYIAEADPLFKDTTLRLLKALQSPLDSRVIGKGLVKEIIYRILSSEYATTLYALTAHDTNLSRINNALGAIHESFQSPIEVADLAKKVNMSTSAFHRAFKEVTTMSPLQYIKKIRLNKARTFILEQKLRVNEAAREVGYESVSHFSREFKKYFGTNPKEIAYND